MKTPADALQRHAQKLLKDFFGYDSFREGQFDIIHSIFDAHNTLVVMPTGGGKSLCYQIPAMMREGTALVISPLIALMKDQVDALQRARVPASFINSSLHLKEMQQRMTNAKFGAYKLLYVAPERLESRHFLQELKSMKISFLAVDEAHCISEWGHDFRPSYLNIPQALAELPPLPVIALTATATSEVRGDIVRALGMRDVETFIRGFDRPNLSYHTVHSRDKVGDAGSLLRAQREGSALVYCGSRRKVDEYAQSFRAMGINCGAYHAGMHEEERSKVQEQFLSGELTVLAATSAFGMGVDKADVRQVLHMDLTLTLEAYYQEAGRAGRDGRDSRCTILYQPGDRRLQEFFIESTYPDKAAIKAVYGFLYDTMGVAKGEKAMNPMYMDDVVIANRLAMPASTVNSVLNVLERADLLRRDSQQRSATLQLLAEPDRLRDYFHHTTAERREVLEALLRGVGPEALRNSVSIDMMALVRKHDIPYDQLHKAIRAFEYARLMRYVPASSGGAMVLTQLRSSLEHIPVDYSAINERKQRALLKLDVVQRYVETTMCKRNFILEYFEEVRRQDECGRCSSCVQPQQAPKLTDAQSVFVRRAIVHCVLELGERFGRTLIAQVLAGKTNPKINGYNLQRCSQFGALKFMSPESVLHAVDTAMHEGLIRQSADLYPRVLVNPAGREVLKGNVPPTLTIVMRENMEVPDDGLYKQLWRVRQHQAALHEVSEQSVLSDAQLYALARQRPTSAADLRRIPGLNSMFVNRYGDEFIRVLRDDRAKDHQEQKQRTLAPSVQATISLIAQGKSLEAIAELRHLSIGTVAAHIQEAIEQGIELDRSLLITNAVFEQVLAVIRKKPRALLKDLRFELGSDTPYAELRVAVAFARAEIERES